MKTKDIALISIAVIILGFTVYSAYGVSSLRDIEKSHIEENVPSSENFDKYLTRDLSKYFSDKLGSPATVKYQLLRNTPAQSGTADPKYYAWVEVTTNNQGEEQGAVRISAIDKEYFHVTDYLSLVSIKRNPEQIDSIFPDDIVDKIKKNFLSNEL